MTSVGFTLAPGASLSFRRLVSVDDATTFASLTDDWAPHHFEEDVARSMGFEAPILHGLLLLALTGKLTSQVLVEAGVEGVTYGYEAVRFPNPAYAGEVIDFDYQVRELRTDKPVVVGDLKATQRERTCLVGRHLLYLTSSRDG